jgi:hypothetical protein
MCVCMKMPTEIIKGWFVHAQPVVSTVRQAQSRRAGAPLAACSGSCHGGNVTGAATYWNLGRESENDEENICS